MNKPQPVAAVSQTSPPLCCNYCGDAHRTVDCQEVEPAPKVEVELVDYVNHQRQQGGGLFVPNPPRGYQNHPAYSWEPTLRNYDQQPQEPRQQYQAQSSQSQQPQYSQPT
ncbi:hypothetical protein M5689_003320 [Euphorbia peplus]|nr:hypothetical protein M5689_003320 [Euphorbia peplus]